MIKKYNTILIGKVLQHLNDCENTNDFFKSRKQASNLPEGMAVYTTRQKSGRGQFGNSWFDEPGKNLAFSFILYPGFLKISEQYYLNMAIANALAEFIGQLTEQSVTIKWPNDIYVKNKKIAGILIENILSGQKIQSSIVGFGINVNNSSFPSDLPNPVSLFQLTGQIMDIDELVAPICEIMEKWYFKLRTGQHKEIHKTYNIQLHGKGVVQLFKENEKTFAGVISGVNGKGRLMVNFNGEIKDYYHKSIEIIP